MALHELQYKSSLQTSPRQSYLVQIHPLTYNISYTTKYVFLLRLFLTLLWLDIHLFLTLFPRHQHRITHNLKRTKLDTQHHRHSQHSHEYHEHSYCHLGELCIVIDLFVVGGSHEFHKWDGNGRFEDGSECGADDSGCVVGVKVVKCGAAYSL
jgi:hypothetical protein